MEEEKANIKGRNEGRGREGRKRRKEGRNEIEEGRAKHEGKE